MAPPSAHTIATSFNPAPHRACQTCGTTVTSQWRYGLSGKVLLCNACGIRWKRKHQIAGCKKLKPGPKRARHTSTSSSIQTINLQPSLSTILRTQSLTSVIRKNVSSTSSVTDYIPMPRKMVYGGAVEQTIARPSGLPSCAKMALGSLICSRDDSGKTVYSAGITKARKMQRPSTIPIMSLLNAGDDDGQSVYSANSAYMRFRT